MTSSDKYSKKTVQLRQRAEKLIQEKSFSPAQNSDKPSPEETKAVLQELMVHKVELEMQNDELCNIRKELEASRARYFDLFNQAPVGYVSLNEDGLILESNLTAATLFGILACELENKLLSQCILFEDQDIFYHHRKKLFTTDFPQVCELRMKRIDKASGTTVFWARLESSLATSDLSDQESLGSDCRSCRIVISDITENRKLAEQLHQAQRMETIGLLAGGMAHDYNNKLAVIIGYADLALSKDISPPAIKVFLESILSAAMQSAAITRQLLTVACKQLISPVVLDLNQAIERMLKMLHQAVGEEIELVWRSVADLYPAKMDPVQIDQILLNLCLNAKAAIDGRGQVTIATKNASFDTEFCKNNSQYSEGKFAMIEVSDTGCGMSKEVLAQIFTPFFTTSGVGQGIGLGLAAVEGIVKQNNGFIIVGSEPGAGTNFSIYLPAYTDKVIDNQCEKPEEILTGSGETVLVVENEVALLSVIKKMLEKLSFNVITASSAVAAVELAEKHKHEIDLLVTDVIMPEMNGYEVLDIIQKTNPDIKTLFIFGHPANVLIRRGFTGTSLNFLQKPFTMSALAEKVVKLSQSLSH